MAMETKHVAMNEKQQAALRKAVNAICKEHNTGVAADLDTRLSYREKDPKNPKAASWDAYSRFLLDDGHSVYVSLRTMKASYSAKPDKWGQAKVEKAAAKKAKAAERKAAKEAKAAAKAAKAAAAKVETTVKAEPETVKFDPSLSTLDAAGKTTPPAVAPKAKIVRKPKADAKA